MMVVPGKNFNLQQYFKVTLLPVWVVTKMAGVVPYCNGKPVSN